MNRRPGPFEADEGFRRLAARVRAARAADRRIRVLIADDHRLFVESLMLMLEVDDEIEVVGRAADGSEATALTAILRPDVVVMDLDMPVMDGFEATSAVLRSSPRTHVIVLTGSRDPEDERRALSAGAEAFLHKDTSVDELRATICKVARPVVSLESARAAAALRSA
jgi:DNA-binding NarL/FixJ family response regulator